MTKEEMLAKLKSLGLNRAYKPSWDVESGHLSIDTRKQSMTNDGFLKGSSIDLYDDHTIRIWTSQKKKAKEIALTNNFRYRLLDNEAEVFIPIDKADQFLHAFGAKVKSSRTYTPEQIAALKDRMAKARAVKQEAKIPQ